MKPTTDQQALIAFFRKKFMEVQDLDVSDYGEDIRDFIETMDLEIRQMGIVDEHSAADAFRDLVVTVINNR